jgi:hypothetical protein
LQPCIFYPSIIIDRGQKARAYFKFAYKWISYYLISNAYQLILMSHFISHIVHTDFDNKTKIELMKIKIERTKVLLNLFSQNGDLLL